MGLEKDDKGALKTNTKNSVKGKKALAHAKAVQNGSSDAFRLADQKTLLSSQGRDGDRTPRDMPIIMLTSKPWPGMGF